MVGFFQSWPVVINFFSSLPLVVFALNGEASVESSTFIYPRAEAVFALVRVLGHISGLCIHPTMNVRATFMWLWAGAEFVERAASGCWGALFILQLVLRSRAHISAPLGFSLRQCLSGHCLTSHHLRMVDVHSILRSCAWAWRSWRAPCVHATTPPHCTRNTRPCGLAHNLT